MHAEQTDLDARAEILRERLKREGRWVTFDLRVAADTAADLLDVSQGTLANWRGEGPPRIRFTSPGGRATYWIVDLLHYIDLKTAA